MSKYISLATQPVCLKHCRQNAFWLTVMLAVAPASTLQAAQYPRPEDKRIEAVSSEASARPLREAGNELSPNRRAEKTVRSVPQAGLVSMVILWDEAAGSAGSSGGRPHTG